MKNINNMDNRKKFQVIVVFNNNDYMQTYFNATDINEIINHYDGYVLEYYNEETTLVYALDIKDMETNERLAYYYETKKIEYL